MSFTSPTLEVSLMGLSMIDPESAQPVCGGRRFKRSFNKKDFPLLGQDEDNQDSRFQPIAISARSKELIPKQLSVSVDQVRRWYRDPETGKWRWPVNGADLVYPGIYLGDA